MGDEDPGNRESLPVKQEALIFSSLIVPGDTRVAGLEEQAKRLMDNYKSLLERLGVTFNDIVHVTLYVRDNSDPRHLLIEYSDRIRGLPPAMSLVEVRSLPENASYALAFIAFVEG